MGIAPVLFGYWGRTEDGRASRFNVLNGYEHPEHQKRQAGRWRNGFVQKKVDHFDRYVTNHHLETATLDVAESLTDINLIYLLVWHVHRARNARERRGGA